MVQMKRLSWNNTLWRCGGWGNKQGMVRLQTKPNRGQPAPFLGLQGQGEDWSQSYWIFVGGDISRKKEKKHPDSVFLSADLLLVLPIGWEAVRSKESGWLTPCDVGAQWRPTSQDAGHVKEGSAWLGSGGREVHQHPCRSQSCHVALPYCSPVSHLVCFCHRNLHRLFRFVGTLFLSLFTWLAIQLLQA